VQWWFIRQTLERELGESLMPVHANGNDWDPSVQPEKFLPSSHRKTTGYARASAYPSAVAETYMQRRYNQAAGTVTGMNQIATSFQKQGISIDYTPVTLPPLQVAHSA